MRQPSPEVINDIPNHFSDVEMDFEDMTIFPNVSAFYIGNKYNETISCAVVNPSPYSQQAQSRNGRIPVALIIPGQFPRAAYNNANENLFSPSLGRWAQWLAQRGIRSVVANPMGMGRSTGDYANESIENLVDMWRRITKEVIRYTNADPQRVRLLTNSMGGHIGLRLSQLLPQTGQASVVDRVALQSPYFYSQLREKANFGNLSRLAAKAFGSRDVAKSPAFRALQSYRGQLYLSLARYDDPPIPEEMQDYALGQLAIAMEQNRGTAITYPYVLHNNRPLDESPFPHILGQTQLRQRTLNQAAENVVDFLSTA